MRQLFHWGHWRSNAATKAIPYFPITPAYRAASSITNSPLDSDIRRVNALTVRVEPA